MGSGSGTKHIPSVPKIDIAKSLASENIEDLDVMVKALAAESNATSLLHRCYRWLKPSLPQPLPCMKRDDKFLSTAETNKAWCTALVEQCAWDEPYDIRFHDLAMQRYKELLVQAAIPGGRRPLDHLVNEGEVVDIRSSWDNSKGMPPDLIPRTHFQ